MCQIMDKFVKAYISLDDLFSGFYKSYYKDEAFIKTVIGSPITKDDVPIGFVSDVDIENGKVGISFYEATIESVINDGDFTFKI